jgi:hypothetical protein
MAVRPQNAAPTEKPVQIETKPIEPSKLANGKDEKPGEIEKKKKNEKKLNAANVVSEEKKPKKEKKGKKEKREKKEKKQQENDVETETAPAPPETQREPNGTFATKIKVFYSSNGAHNQKKKVETSADESKETKPKEKVTQLIF